MFNFIIGFVVGGIVVYLFMLTMKKPEKPIQASETTNPNPNVEIKKENVAKLESFVAQKQAGDKITNDEVQALLKVSDATAERYLQELEQKGLLKQVGVIGQDVHYLKV